MEQRIGSIVLLGAGNVGYHLGRQLAAAGVRIEQVFSRQLPKAEALAQLIGAMATDDLNKIAPAADVYILAVHDSAIAEVAARLPVQDQLIVHTSGATPSTILQPYSSRWGVFYPLQTFSLAKPVDFERIPICVYANNTPDMALLTDLAQRLSPKVYSIDDAQRAILHVAAVFVNNFTNYLFQIAYDIMQKENLPFDLLRPLICETAEKVQVHPPREMQTGPAIRRDATTIAQHLAYLKAFPEYQHLYQMITESIQKQEKDTGPKS